MLWTQYSVFLVVLATFVAGAPNPHHIVTRAAQFKIRVLSIPTDGIPGPAPQPNTDDIYGGFLQKNPEDSGVEIWTRRELAITQPILSFTLVPMCTGDSYELHHGSQKLAYVLNPQEFNTNDSPFNLIPATYPQTEGVYFSDWTVKQDHFGRMSLGLSIDDENFQPKAGNKWIEVTAAWDSGLDGEDPFFDGFRISSCGSCYDEESCYTNECPGRTMVLEVVQV